MSSAYNLFENIFTFVLVTFKNIVHIKDTAILSYGVKPTVKQNIFITKTRGILLKYTTKNEFLYTSQSFALCIA